MLKKEKKTLSSVVYDYLSNKILNNELLPGDKLIEMDIANDLEVSRTPVREALVKLADEGLAENFPRKSYIVSKISLKLAKELYEVRSALEPIAIRDIAKNGLVKKAVVLEDVFKEMKLAYEKKDYDQLTQEIVNWNITILPIISNPVIKDTLMVVTERLYRFSNYIFKNPKNIETCYKQIEKIYSAIVNKDPEKAFEESYNYVTGMYPMLESEGDYKTFRS